MRNKNYILLFLCLVVISFFGFFAYRTIGQIIHFSRLTETAQAKIERLEIRTIKKNYIVWAYFSFFYKEKVYEASAPLGVSYPNPWSAAKAIQEREARVLDCWFSPKEVGEACLIKKFPWHSLLSSLILAGILLYFGGMALYLHKRA